MQLLFKVLTHQRDMDLPRKYLSSIAQNQFRKRGLFFFNHNSIRFDQVTSDLEATTNTKTDGSSRFRFVVAAVVAAIRQKFSDLRQTNITQKTEVATAQLKFDNNRSVFLTTLQLQISKFLQEVTVSNFQR